MAKTFNRMRIDVNEKPNSICINPVQNDTQSRYLDVSLYNNGLPIDLTGEVVRINFKKEDGTTFFNQGEITNAAEGRCQFALTNEVLSEAKTLKAQISIWSGEGEILSTQVFTIYVTESIRNDEEVESTNEFGVLVVLFQEIQNSLDLMKALMGIIGNTDDVGGGLKEGTVMAKLNALFMYRPVYSEEYQWSASDKISASNIGSIACDEEYLYLGVSIGYSDKKFLIKKYDCNSLELVKSSENLDGLPEKICIDANFIYARLSNATVIKLDKDLNVLLVSNRIAYTALVQDSDYLYTFSSNALCRLKKETFSQSGLQIEAGFSDHGNLAAIDEQNIYFRASESATQSNSRQKIFKIDKENLRVLKSVDVDFNTFYSIPAVDDSFFYCIRGGNIRSISKWDKETLEKITENLMIKPNTKSDLLIIDNKIIVPDSFGKNNLSVLNKKNLDPIYCSDDAISEFDFYLCKNESNIFAADKGSGLIMKFPLSPKIKYKLEYYEEVEI